MSALLTSVEGDKDNKPFYLNAARMMGIRVLPPDVNESAEHFAPAGEDVRYGLAAVRNVGEGAVQQIILARNEKGPFESFRDFCEKVEPNVLHKKILESLILAGAFDSVGYKRRGLLEGYDKVVTPILGRRRAEAAGQESLFGGDAGVELDEIDEARVVADVEFDRDDLLRQEKEMLGQYVTDHPLLAVKDQLARAISMEMVELSGPEVGDGDILTLGGIVGSVGRKFTKRGEQYAIIRLEDLTGGVGVVVFPSLFEQTAGLIAPDRILLVKGRADLRGRELQLVALEIIEPHFGSSSAGGGQVVRNPALHRPVRGGHPRATLHRGAHPAAEGTARGLRREPPGDALPRRRARLAAVAAGRGVRRGRFVGPVLRASPPPRSRRRPGGGARAGRGVVAFEVLPAIDLYQGRMARMIRGDRSTIETLDLDPVELLREWAAAGVHWVHIVDLDAAWGGAPSTLDVLAAAGELGLWVEAGGGLSERGVAAALEQGATRAVLGAAALLQPGAVERAVAAHGDRVAVGLDVRGGVVAPRGTGVEGPQLDVAVRRLADARPAMVVFTDADRDGSLAGPDLSALARVVEAIGVPVLASGGVRSAADVRALAKARPAPAGVIVGRALHDGVLSIVEALAAAAVD